MSLFDSHLTSIPANAVKRGEPVVKIKLDSSVISHVVSKEAPTKLAKIVIKDDRAIVGETFDVGPDGLRKSLEIGASVVEDAVPCYLLCRIEGKSNTPRWALIIWTPEEASFRERTIYSHARKPLLSILGNGYFVEELSCCTKDSLDIDLVRLFISTAIRRKKNRNSVENDVASNGFVTKDFHQKQRPFPPLPFIPGEGFANFVGEFVKGNLDCIMLTVNDEDSTIIAQKNREQSPASIAQRLYQREPRFYLVRYNQNIVLCLSSPEGSTKHSRLLYASSKTAVVDLLEEAGVEVWKSVDVRIPNDMSEVIFEDELDAEFMPFASQKLRPKKKRKGSNLVKLYPHIQF